MPPSQTYKHTQENLVAVVAVNGVVCRKVAHIQHALQLKTPENRNTSHSIDERFTPPPTGEHRLSFIARYSPVLQDTSLQQNRIDVNHDSVRRGLPATGTAFVNELNMGANTWQPTPQST